jgi:hypothetical protein
MFPNVKKWASDDPLLGDTSQAVLTSWTNGW